MKEMNKKHKKGGYRRKSNMNGRKTNSFRIEKWARALELDAQKKETSQEKELFGYKKIRMKRGRKPCQR